MFSLLIRVFIAGGAHRAITDQGRRATGTHNGALRTLLAIPLVAGITHLMFLIA